MAWQGVEIEIEVPCAEGQTHPVRLRFTGWGEYEVAYNPCEELLGPVFARMARCTHYLHEEFPRAFREDTDLKRRLVEALGTAGAPAVPTLIEALGDDMVVKLGLDLDDLFDDFSDDSFEQGNGVYDVRRAVCEALGKLGDPQAVPALSVWAHAGEDAARNALQTLGHPALALPQAVAQVVAQGAWGVLIRALPNEKVRKAVVGLGAPAVPALIQALGDRDLYVRCAAVEALGELGDLQAVPALIQALGDRDLYVRRVAAEALGKLGDPQAVPVLIQALGDWNEAVRRAAAEALGKLGDPQAVPVLIQALGDRYTDVRRAAAEALGELGDPQAVPALIQALGDRYTDVRRAAAEALGELGDPQAVPALIKALGDSDRRARESACEALAKISIPAVPKLIEALEYSNQWVRAAACWVLGKIGDPQALPYLRKALKDASEWVQWEAQRAITQIKD